MKPKPFWPLFDETGDRLATVYGTNPKRRLRYFVSARLTGRSLDRTDDRTGWRIPAIQTEQILSAAISQALKDAGHVPNSREGVNTVHTVEDAGATVLSNPEQSALLDLVERAQVGLGHLNIHLQPKKVAALLNISVADVPDTLRAFSAPFHRRRRGFETKLIFGHQAPAVDPVLLKWAARGWVWWKEIRPGKASVHQIAEREKVTARALFLCIWNLRSWRLTSSLP